MSGWNLGSISSAFNVGGLNQVLKNANRGLRTGQQVDRQMERGQTGRAAQTVGGAMRRQGRQIEQGQKREYNLNKREVTKEFRKVSQEASKKLTKDYQKQNGELRNEHGKETHALQKEQRAEMTDLTKKYRSGEMDADTYKEKRIDLGYAQREKMGELRGEHKEESAELRQTYQDTRQGLVGKDAMEQYVEERIGPKPQENELSTAGETLGNVGRIMDTMERMGR